jgi:hypothetical protein
VTKISVSRHPQVDAVNAGVRGSVAEPRVRVPAATGDRGPLSRKRGGQRARVARQGARASPKATERCGGAVTPAVAWARRYTHAPDIYPYASHDAAGLCVTTWRGVRELQSQSRPRNRRARGRISRSRPLRSLPLSLRDIRRKNVQYFDQGGR